MSNVVIPIVTLTFPLLIGSCATTQKNQSSPNMQLPPPPAITDKTSIDDLVSLGIEYGGDTLQKVKKEIKDRKIFSQVEKDLVPILSNADDTLADHQLLNAANLYGSLPTTLDPKLFKILTNAERVHTRRVGWQLAALKADRSLKQEMERVLSQALIEDNLTQILLPQMANAVRLNRLSSAYTLVRQGLMTQGDEEYALAMMALNPNLASEDFLSYLLLAPPEELRQLSVSSIKIYTAMTILRHLRNYPPNVGHPGFDHLFSYMVSRNNGLSDLARGVIESYLPKDAEILAVGLARQPPWLQIALIENIRRQKTPGLTLLLQELKQTTSEINVAKDIDEISE